MNTSEPKAQEPTCGETAAPPADVWRTWAKVACARARQRHGRDWEIWARRQLSKLRAAALRAQTTHCGNPGNRPAHPPGREKRRDSGGRLLKAGGIKS